MKAVLVVGTDTGVGKTLVTASMLLAYAGLGRRVIGMKPVAAGAEQINGVWQNEDVARLRACSNVEAPPELVNPYLFREPIAPHIAADRKGVAIEIPRIRAALDDLLTRADVVLVEGVGGFRAPLSANRDTAALAVALGLPVVLVVGMRLGCLNHALLTAEAIANRSLTLAGWVANRIDPDMMAYAENQIALAQRLGAPLLAEIPFMPQDSLQRAATYFSPRRLEQLLPAAANGPQG